MTQYVPVEVRRRQLVETALTIAEGHGPAAVTARRVAHEAGVSLGVVHYCFESTGELAARMAEHIVEQLAEVALPALDYPTEGADLRSLLEHAIAALWAQVEASSLRQLLTYEMTTYAVRTPGLERVTRRLYEVSDAAAAHILLYAGEVAGVTWSVDVAQLARLTVMAIDGATLRWLTDGDSVQALASLSRVADLIAGYATTTAGGHSPPPVS